MTEQAADADIAAAHERVRRVLSGAEDVLLVATSGSTGRPKVVELPGSALRASAEAAHARLGGAGRWLLALPVTGVAGLNVLARSVLADAEPVVLDPGAASDPAALAAAARRGGGAGGGSRGGSAGGPAYASLVPTQVVRLAGSAAGVDALRRFRAVLVGGAAADAGLLERLRSAGVRAVATYGSTETCGGCVYDGWPLDGVAVRVRPGDGRVEVAGPVLARGYAGRPDRTAAAFRVEGGTRWYVTEDRGLVGPSGELRVLGRADDVVVTGGVNVAPAAVEAVLLRHPGIAAACVVGVPDEEWGEVVVAAVVPGGAEGAPSLEALRSLVAARLGAPAAPRRVLVLAALPEVGPGEPDRAGVRLLVQEDDDGRS